jgi:hypothetical protein
MSGFVYFIKPVGLRGPTKIAGFRDLLPRRATRATGSLPISPTPAGPRVADGSIKLSEPLKDAE